MFSNFHTSLSQRSDYPLQENVQTFPYPVNQTMTLFVNTDDSTRKLFVCCRKEETVGNVCKIISNIYYKTFMAENAKDFTRRDDCYYEKVENRHIRIEALTFNGFVLPAFQIIGEMLENKATVTAKVTFLKQLNERSPKAIKEDKRSKIEKAHEEEKIKRKKYYDSKPLDKPSPGREHIVSERHFKKNPKKKVKTETIVCSTSSRKVVDSSDLEEYEDDFKNEEPTFVKPKKRGRPKKILDQQVPLKTEKEKPKNKDGSAKKLAKKQEVNIVKPDQTRIHLEKPPKKQEGEIVKSDKIIAKDSIINTKPCVKKSNNNRVVDDKEVRDESKELIDAEDIIIPIVLDDSSEDEKVKKNEEILEEEENHLEALLQFEEEKSEVVIRINSLEATETKNKEIDVEDLEEEEHQMDDVKEDEEVMIIPEFMGMDSKQIRMKNFDKEMNIIETQSEQVNVSYINKRIEEIDIEDKQIKKQQNDVEADQEMTVVPITILQDSEEENLDEEANKNQAEPEQNLSQIESSDALRKVSSDLYDDVSSVDFMIHSPLVSDEEGVPVYKILKEKNKKLVKSDEASRKRGRPKKQILKENINNGNVVAQAEGRSKKVQQKDTAVPVLGRSKNVQKENKVSPVLGRKENVQSPSRSPSVSERPKKTQKANLLTPTPGRSILDALTENIIRTIDKTTKKQL